MPTFVLVPGADCRAWYWHLVVPELRLRGYDATAVDLPFHPEAGLNEHADAIEEAIGDASGRVVLVAQSLAGFSAPLVCERVAIERMVLVNAMTPLPGETAGQWWADTGQPQAAQEYARAQGRTPGTGMDPREDFFNEVPASLVEEALSAGPAGPPEALFSQPWPLAAWPHVPTRFLQARDDRFLPLEFQRRLVRERLGIEVEEIPGGHLPALSHPADLAWHLTEDVL